MRRKYGVNKEGECRGRIRKKNGSPLWLEIIHQSLQNNTTHQIIQKPNYTLFFTQK
jgi:hypothetical protein